MINDDPQLYLIAFFEVGVEVEPTFPLKGHVPSFATAVVDNTGQKACATSSKYWWDLEIRGNGNTW
jgi:hypothetical protein